ncbi:sugar isomerase [Nitrosopumilus cobalaminigenes]|uniref:Sugar isomerase n=1 Tax=Nitrosopumilus cobalaminigenes TaxID=1470066 RepID=A0A7D5M0N4_9ARCH|nr:SIS domain-containing protein [Nitrosopumilus cobalaminigenes]QLH03011.1 sugar isomerase [Nitrosopumilus cobalaminigenes]
MNSIEAYENDIQLQLDFLKSFKKQKTLSASSQKNILFSGSGDSLVSALLAESFSNGLTKAMDPLDLYQNKSLAKSKQVYFVSISGNTITNIKVAKIAKKALAITSQPQSKLAKASDRTILLKSTNSGIFTAGSISFLESALTCISLVSNIKIPNISLFRKAATSAKKAKLSKRIFVLGNFHTFPIAMYCAAKFYEILGYDVHYSRIEQFSHMELFSAKRGDTVIIFEEKNPHTKQLGKNLKNIGINVVHPDVPKEKLSQVIFCVFFSQLISLYEAKRTRKKECHFVTAEKVRDVSNRMIY